jgi:phosphate transport system substrate-binding protein
MKLRRALFWSVVCAVGLSVAGCRGEEQSTPSSPAAPQAPSADAGLKLTGAGASFPYPLYSKWFDSYHQAHADVSVNYQSIGSGGGIQQLKNRTVDFGASDPPLSAEEEKEMPSPVVHLPMTAGAVALVYNLPGISASLKLTPEAIAGIFLGKITKWNDPAIASANAGVTLPDTPVAVAQRSDSSGTTFLFTHYLAAVSPEWTSKVGSGKAVKWPVGLGGKGNEGVTGLVKQTPGSIGYVELAYALQNNLKSAQVRNQAGQFVEPSVTTTAAAVEGALPALAKDIRTLIVNPSGKTAYPIAGLTYILVYREQAKRETGQALVHLLEWCLDEGQKMAPGLNYAPLPAAVVKRNKTELGTVSSGAP